MSELIRIDGVTKVYQGGLTGALRCWHSAEVGQPRDEEVCADASGHDNDQYPPVVCHPTAEPLRERARALWRKGKAEERKLDEREHDQVESQDREHIRARRRVELGQQRKASEVVGARHAVDGTGRPRDPHGVMAHRAVVQTLPLR